MPTKPHPRQPIVIGKDKIRRFKRNAIVCLLLDSGKFDMNDIARIEFSKEDRRQFAQLIGYSVSGYNDLSYSEGNVE